MNILVEEITKLTDEWYFLIGKDHHKDHDCHWYIETKWSYGLSPTYVIWHYGYILDEIHEECDSYEIALLKLKKILTEKIAEEKRRKIQNDDL